MRFRTGKAGLSANAAALIKHNFSLDLELWLAYETISMCIYYTDISLEQVKELVFLIKHFYFSSSYKERGVLSMKILARAGSNEWHTYFSGISVFSGKQDPLISGCFSSFPCWDAGDPIFGFTPWVLRLRSCLRINGFSPPVCYASVNFTAIFGRKSGGFQSFRVISLISPCVCSI